MKTTLTSKICMTLICLTFTLMAMVEAKATCNPYTYKNCSGAQLQAISRVQFQKRNNIQQQVSEGEKLYRIVKGTPTQRWMDTPAYTRAVVKFILVNDVWTTVRIQK